MFMLRKRYIWWRSKELCSLVSSRWNLHGAFRCFRSKPALEALSKASEERIPNVILYNYPSFTGALAALFAKLYHSQLNIQSLILPFSSVEPLRVEDLNWDGLEICYLLDFFGPKGFAVSLAKQIPQVVVFDHRESTMARIGDIRPCPHNLILKIDTEKTSAHFAFDHFSRIAAEQGSTEENKFKGLMNSVCEQRLKEFLVYIEDGDLRRWILPNIKAFNIGLKQELCKLNCLTNPFVFDELLEVNASDLITRGDSYMNARTDAAKKLLGKTFRVKLGRGLYGECLGVRADGNSGLSHEIGIELSQKSASAGLRPIGAVVFLQRRSLKMCLRSTDDNTDTSEVAKAYGGGGTKCSSSFIIRMDEYNQWVSVN